MVIKKPVRLKALNFCFNTNFFKEKFNIFIVSKSDRPMSKTV